MRLEGDISFLTFDLSSRISSVCIPLASLKQLPERQVTVRGFVAEVMATSSYGKDNFGSNYSHTTYFVKVN
jgi:hypothetical protein